MMMCTLESVVRLTEVFDGHIVLDLHVLFKFVSSYVGKHKRFMLFCWSQEHLSACYLVGWDGLSD